MAYWLHCDARDAPNCSSAIVRGGCGPSRRNRATTKPEHVRVEFVPGSGDVLEFVTVNGKVGALVYDDLRFEKAR